MSTDGQGTKCHRNITENFNCHNRVQQRYRRQTDRQATAYSEHEHEFTFAKTDGSELDLTQFYTTMVFFRGTFYSQLYDSYNHLDTDYSIQLLHHTIIYARNRTIHIGQMSYADPPKYCNVKQKQTRMWADAQRDGRPAEYWWRPCGSSIISFFVPCRNVWLMPITRVPCSNAANIRERKTWT